MDRILRFGFLAFALFAIIFGFIRIGQTIRLTIIPDEIEQAAPGEPNSLDDIKLRVTDTDEDGLYDWDEINIYNTSAYLADTDSDSISDSEEISQGTDPNCPTGQTCGSGIIDLLEEFSREQTALEQDLADSLPVEQDLSDNAQAILDVLQAGSTPTPEQVKGLLREQGISEDQLSQTTDEELLQLFEEAMADMRASQ